MPSEPSVDMLRANRLRLKFNLEKLYSKYEKIQECGIEIDLDAPDPQKTTFYIPNGMSPREVSKHKQNFYVVSENFSLAPLSARLNDDEALDFNESLKKKCEKRDREFNECIALTPYALNETLESVKNKTFRMRETETVRTVSTEGVTLSELEDYVQSMHPDGEIVFRAVENNVSIIKIRFKKTVTVSNDSETEQLQIQGGGSSSENAFEREFREIQRRRLIQLAIEGPPSVVKGENEEDAESIRSGTIPLYQEDSLSVVREDCVEGTLKDENDMESIHSWRCSLNVETEENVPKSSDKDVISLHKVPQPNTLLPVRKTPSRACKSTTTSPATAKTKKGRCPAIMTTSKTDEQATVPLRRSLRGASQPAPSSPSTLTKRRSGRRTSGSIEPVESQTSESGGLPEQSDHDKLIEQALGRKSRQDVELDRQSEPVPHSEDYFSVPEEILSPDVQNPVEAPKKRTRRKAKKLTQKKQKRVRPRKSSKVSQTAESPNSDLIGKDEDGSGTVYDEVYTPEASSRGAQPGSEVTVINQCRGDENLLQIPIVSSIRKRPASQPVGVSPASKKSRKLNEAITPGTKELSTGFWQENGKGLLNKFAEFGIFQSVVGVAKEWLPVYSPIDKPLIDHWAEATLYWKENRSRDFTSGFQDFEGRQLISAAKARNNNIIHGFDCP